MWAAGVVGCCGSGAVDRQGSGKQVVAATTRSVETDENATDAPLELAEVFERTWSGRQAPPWRLVFKRFAEERAEWLGWQVESFRKMPADKRVQLILVEHFGGPDFRSPNRQIVILNGKWHGGLPEYSSLRTVSTTVRSDEKWEAMFQLADGLCRGRGQRFMNTPHRYDLTALTVYDGTKWRSVAWMGMAQALGIDEDGSGEFKKLIRMVREVADMEGYDLIEWK